MDIIYLNSMTFTAYHGVHDFEAIHGGEFQVDIELQIDLSKAGKSDRLEDTVDYEKVYSLVSREMKIRASLLEHVAYRIKENILESFPALEKVTVKISKIEPPIKGKVGSTAVKVSGVRS